MQRDLKGFALVKWPCPFCSSAYPYCHRMMPVDPLYRKMHASVTSGVCSSDEPQHGRSCLNLVKLPRSMLPPQHTLPLRRPRSASKVASCMSEAQHPAASSMQSTHSRSGLPFADTEDPSADCSSTAPVRPNCNHLEQPQPADTIATLDSALQQDMSAANAQGSLSGAQDAGCTGSQHSSHSQHGTDDAGEVSAAGTGPTHAADVSNSGTAPAGQIADGIYAQGLCPAAGGVPEGQLGDLPDKPGHLATAEQCQAANGGVCWHLLQIAIKAREIACKADTVPIVA